VALIGGPAEQQGAFAKNFFGSDEFEFEPDQTPKSQTIARLKNRQLAVVCLRDISGQTLEYWTGVAREYHALSFAVTFSREGERRSDFGRDLKSYGFRDVHFAEDFERARRPKIKRVPLWPDKRDLSGPFDIIGGIHGCTDELCELLDKLGYSLSWYDDLGQSCAVVPPSGRTAVFIGNLGEDGSSDRDVYAVVRGLAQSNAVLCVWGEEDDLERQRILKKNWKDVSYRSYLTEFDDDFTFSSDHQRSLKNDIAVSHLWLDQGNLVVVNAAIKQEMIGRSSRAVRDYCIYGEDTTDRRAATFQNRATWIDDYCGAASVVHGRALVKSPEWQKNTIGINTGCEAGGCLTALRWPERELVSVPAKR